MHADEYNKLPQSYKEVDNGFIIAGYLNTIPTDPEDLWRQKAKEEDAIKNLQAWKNGSSRK